MMRFCKVFFLLVLAGCASVAPEETARPSGRVPSGISSSTLNENFVWPVQGKVVFAFGMRHRGKVNKGIDIQTIDGAAVMAARSGKISFIHESLPGFGKTIIVDHGDRVATVYAYLAEILVRPGESVSRRQMIGRTGRTGRSQVPILHFEIRRAQKPQNPFYYLP